MQDYTNISASLQGKLIGEGKLCPIDLCEAYLDKIKSSDESKLIFSDVMEESAKNEAISAKQRSIRGTRLSNLDGICLSWKDLFEIKNRKTAAGSHLLKDMVSQQTAEVLQNTSFAGITCLGKTHMTELAFSGLGINPITATPPNSIRADLAPGGSSSGAGVSTSLGLSSASIGSDTGGSVRVPAAWNNVVGFKTSHGALPLNGVIPLCPSFDTIGPLTKTVQDASEIYSVLLGSRFTPTNSLALKNRSFLVIETVALENLDKAIDIQFENSVRKIAERGAKIKRCKLEIVEQTIGLSPLLFAPEAYSIWENNIENSPHVMFKPILERFRSGRETLAKDFIKAWDNLRRFRSEFNTFANSFDAVLLPTTPLLPPKTEKLLTNEVFFNEANLNSLRNTRIANLFDQCALTLPTDTDFCGLSIMMPRGMEAKLIAIGLEIEKIF